MIGITGGVGSGKSTVLAYLREAYGAVVIQADLVAKALQEKGQKVFLDIVAAFGQSILDEKGDLDRSALAEIVFHDGAERKLLNQIVHPAVERQIRAQISRSEKAGVRFLFVESALLLQCGYDSFCGEIWFIDAGESKRRKRLSRSRGYSGEKIQSIFDSQMTEEAYRAGSDVRIHNGGEWTDTIKQLDRQMERLKKKAKIQKEDK